MFSICARSLKIFVSKADVLYQVCVSSLLLEIGHHLELYPETIHLFK